MDSHEQTNEKTLLGFWFYIMTDLLSFAILFATYAVLSANTAGGPHTSELFDLKFVLIETFILLTSSYTAGLALLAIRRGDKKWVLVWLGLTFAFGLAFLGMEMNEFSKLIAEGASWKRKLELMDCTLR
jgi:cytochrome o ubiquinol oxidase subunit 3